MANNLPPGCKVSDLPGCRSIDVAWEEFNKDTERVAEIIKENLSEMTNDRLVEELYDQFEYAVHEAFVEQYEGEI